MKFQKSLKLGLLAIVASTAFVSCLADQLQVGDVVVKCQYTNEGGQVLTENILRSACIDTWHGTVMSDKTPLEICKDNKKACKDVKDHAKCNKQYTKCVKNAQKK
jgi:hypothetical protein